MIETPNVRRFTSSSGDTITLDPAGVTFYSYAKAIEVRIVRADAVQISEVIFDYFGSVPEPDWIVL